MKKILLNSMLLSVWLVSGCSVMPASLGTKFTNMIPGSTVPTQNKEIMFTDHNTTQEMSEAELNQRAAVYPISLSLLQQMKAPVARARSNPALEAQKQNYRYRVGVGDVLYVKMFNQPDFNTYQTTNAAQGITIDETGHIFYPLAGKVLAKGKSLAEIQQVLTQRLAKYYKNPQLDVSIAQFRSQSISVNGAVKQSGKFPINDVPLTLLDAVSLAGGLTDLADTNQVKWTHNGRENTLSLQDLFKHGDMAQNKLLSNGDVVYIPARTDVQVYVLGEVGKQNVLTLDNNGLNLTEALARSEGMKQEYANATGVFVFRNVPRDAYGKNIHIYQLNLKDATAYALGTQFNLQASDVVYVTTAPITRWNRVLSQLIPTVSGIATSKNTFQ